jgi:hypothetical protein
MRLGALKARQIIARGETPGTVAKLMRALKGRKRFLPPFQGSDQILYFPRGFTPGYYLSRFQRSGKGTRKIRQDQQFSVFSFQSIKIIKTENWKLKTENYFLRSSSK